MDKLRFVELFAGIGGFSLGFERAGMECVGHVEIEPYAQKVLLKHWPDVPLMEDVKDVKGTEFGQVDLLCGGFPCQDLSVAGNQAGFHNKDGSQTRSGLYDEIIRIAGVCRPKYIVLENVANLLSRPDWFGYVLGRLAEIGFDVEWEIIRASDVGLPHLRERVFVVGCSNSLGFKNSTKDQISGLGGLQGELYRSLEEIGERWNVCKPFTYRSGHGIPNWAHRLKCIGNALVPQIAEYIGQCILEREKVITYLSD